jgi:hypothetical protein
VQEFFAGVLKGWRAKDLCAHVLSKCDKEQLFMRDDTIFPIGPGGAYEGFTPIFQGNNTDPHQHQVLMKSITEYCKLVGWH